MNRMPMIKAVCLPWSRLCALTAPLAESSSKTDAYRRGMTEETPTSSDIGYPDLGFLPEHGTGEANMVPRQSRRRRPWVALAKTRRKRLLGRHSHSGRHRLAGPSPPPVYIRTNAQHDA
jgi:hypothetical protein